MACLTAIDVDEYSTTYPDVSPLLGTMALQGGPEVIISIM